MLYVRRLLFCSVLATSLGMAAWLVWLFLVALTTNFWPTMATPVSGTVVGFSVWIVQKYLAAAKHETNATSAAQTDRPSVGVAISAGVCVGVLVFGVSAQAVMQDFILKSLIPLAASCTTLFVVGLVLSNLVIWKPVKENSEPLNLFGIFATVLCGVLLGLFLSGLVKGVHWLMGYRTEYFGGWILLGITILAGGELFRQGRWSVVWGVVVAMGLVLLLSQPRAEGLYDAILPRSTNWNYTAEQIAADEKPPHTVVRAAILCVKAVEYGVALTLSQPDLPGEMWTKFESEAKPPELIAQQPGLVERCLGCGDRADAAQQLGSERLFAFIARRFAEANDVEKQRLEPLISPSAEVVRQLIEQDPEMLRWIRDERLGPYWYAEPTPVIGERIQIPERHELPEWHSAATVDEDDVRAFERLLRTTDPLIHVTSIPSTPRGEFEASQRKLHSRIVESWQRRLEQKEANRTRLRQLRDEYDRTQWTDDDHRWRTRRLCSEARKGFGSGLLRSWCVLLFFAIGLAVAPRLEEKYRPPDYASSRTRRYDICWSLLMLALLIGSVTGIARKKSSVDRGVDDPSSDSTVSQPK